MSKTDVFECNCAKCKHKWIKRTVEQPRQCPKCKSYSWLGQDGGISDIEWFNTNGGSQT